MPKVALGKGLGALINQRVASPTPMPELGERVQQIRLDDITPTPLQPRTEFRGEKLRELVDSIREHGIIQPLIVRQRLDKFELIAGERRWRAAKEVGLLEAPVIVRAASDQEVLELALIENLQREDLNPIEEALRLFPAGEGIRAAPGGYRAKGRQEPRRHRQLHAAARVAPGGPGLAGA